MNRKAQVWIVDFIVGMMIFSIGLILASRFIINSAHIDDFGDVRASAETMSEFLISEGVPSNWTNDTVVRIGLTTDDRLNLTKTNQLFTEMTYSDTRTYLSTEYDYLVYFQNNESIINISGICGYGGTSISNCTIDLTNLTYDNLVRTGRFLVYNDSIIEMVLYVWN